MKSATFRQKNMGRYDSTAICKVMKSARSQFREKIANLNKKVIVRKRSFEDIQDEYKKNEQDMQKFFKAFRTHLGN